MLHRSGVVVAVGSREYAERRAARSWRSPVIRPLPGSASQAVAVVASGTGGSNGDDQKQAVVVVIACEGEDDREVPGR